MQTDTEVIGEVTETRDYARLRGHTLSLGWTSLGELRVTGTLAIDAILVVDIHREQRQCLSAIDAIDVSIDVRQMSK